MSQTALSWFQKQFQGQPISFPFPAIKTSAGTTYMLVELSRLKEAREAYAKSPLPPPVVPVIISDCVSEDRIKGHHIMLSNTLCQGIDDPLPSLPELIGVMNELK